MVLVFVLPDNSSTPIVLIVKLVTMLVLPVPLITLVLPVPTKPELMVPFVNVKITTMTTVFPNVHHVKNNVTSVPNLHPTVSSVPMEESTHQNVTSHHKKLELLKLKISLSVLLKSSCVIPNV
jgi:hypothetical protein